MIRRGLELRLVLIGTWSRWFIPTQKNNWLAWFFDCTKRMLLIRRPSDASTRFRKCRAAAASRAGGRPIRSTVSARRRRRRRRLRPWPPDLATITPACRSTATATVSATATTATVRYLHSRRQPPPWWPNWPSRAWRQPRPPPRPRPPTVPVAPSTTRPITTTPISTHRRLPAVLLRRPQWSLVPRRRPVRWIITTVPDRCRWRPSRRPWPWIWQRPETPPPTMEIIRRPVLRHGNSSNNSSSSNSNSSSTSKTVPPTRLWPGRNRLAELRQRLSSSSSSSNSSSRPTFIRNDHRVAIRSTAAPSSSTAATAPEADNRRRAARRPVPAVRSRSLRAVPHRLPTAASPCRPSRCRSLVSRPLFRRQQRRRRPVRATLQRRRPPRQVPAAAAPVAAPTVETGGSWIIFYFITASFSPDDWIRTLYAYRIPHFKYGDMLSMIFKVPFQLDPRTSHEVPT